MGREREGRRKVVGEGEQKEGEGVNDRQTDK